MKVLIVTLDNQYYGVDLQQIQSVEKLPEITGIPLSYDYIKGVTVLHGNLIPVMDLKERLHMGENTYSEQTRMVVAVVNGMQMGLIVDSAKDIAAIEEDSIETAHDYLKSKNDMVIQGIVKQDNYLITLLDLKKIIDLKTYSDLPAQLDQEISLVKND